MCSINDGVLIFINHFTNISLSTSSKHKWRIFGPCVYLFILRSMRFFPSEFQTENGIFPFHRTLETRTLRTEPRNHINFRIYIQLQNYIFYTNELLLINKTIRMLQKVNTQFIQTLQAYTDCLLIVISYRNYFICILLEQWTNLWSIVYYALNNTIIMCI